MGNCNEIEMAGWLVGTTASLVGYV